MNLYVISQDECVGYDTWDSAVVAADNEAAARLIHPAVDRVWAPSGRWEYKELPGTEAGYHDWAFHPDKVSVEFIGKAKRGTKAGVILASFNAG